MKRFKLVSILTIWLILILFNPILFAQSDDGNCLPAPPDRERRPGNDHGDDNFSMSDAIVKEYNLAPEAVIYLNGYHKEAFKLFGGLLFDGNNPAQELIKTTPLKI